MDALLTPTLGRRSRAKRPWILVPQAVLALAGAPAVTLLALLNGRRLGVPRAHQAEVLVAGAALTAVTWAIALGGGPYLGPAAGVVAFAVAYRRQRARDRVYRATIAPIDDFGALLLVGGAIFFVTLFAQFALFAAVGS
jgi:hypothetical protein